MRRALKACMRRFAGAPVVVLRVHLFVVLRVHLPRLRTLSPASVAANVPAALDVRVRLPCLRRAGSAL
eukprot:6178281-Pleurochrysis_carterae.AAC.2